MADEQEILSYIIRGQDQTRQLLEQHAEILNRIATSAKAMADSVDDAGKKAKQAAENIGGLQQFIKDFVGNTDTASNAAKNFSGVVSDAFTNPTSLVKDFAGVLGDLVTGPMAIALGAATALATAVALLGKELIDVTLEARDMGASFDDLARKTQASVPGLSSLSFAAQAVNSDITALGRAMFTLQQRLELNPAEIQRGLAELNKNSQGVTLTLEQLSKAAREDVSKAILLLSDSFSKAGKEVDTAAAIGQIFTKRFGQDLLPLLTRATPSLRELTEESKALGYTWSTEEAEAAKKLQIEMNKLQLQFESWATQIGRVLIPEVQDLVSDFENLITILKVLKALSPLQDMEEDLKFIEAALNRISKAPAAPAAPPMPGAKGGPAYAGPDLVGGDAETVSQNAAAAARLKSVYDNLHGTLETVKRDQQEIAAITKETINAQLAAAVAVIHETETGYQAQLDVAERTHRAHVDIINAEVASAQKRSAYLLAEDQKYAAQRIEINNRANKSLVELTIQIEKEMGRVHEDANASWLSKRYDVIEADKQEMIDAARVKFGATQQFLDAQDRIEALARDRRAAAESQSEKKFEQDIAKVSGDIEIIKVQAMEEGLAKQIELINQRVLKEQEAAAKLGLTDEQLQAYRELLGEKGDVEREVARVTNARRIADELFGIENETQQAMQALTLAGTAKDLAQLEQQRDARLRYIKLYEGGNKELIDATNKFYDVQADIIKQHGVLTQQQWGHLSDDALRAYQLATAAGVEGADKLQQRWQEYWDLQHQELLGLVKEWSDLSDAVGRLFASIASHGTGGFYDFAKAAGEATSGISGAVKAATELHSALDRLNDPSTHGVGAFLQLAQAGTNVAASVDQAKTMLGSIISGAAAGAQFGWQGAIAGAIIGAFIGALQDASDDDQVQRQIQRTAQAWGRYIGTSLAEEIAKLQKEFHISELVAQAIDINKIISETGGLGSVSGVNGTVESGFGQAARAMGVLLVELIHHGQDAEVVLKGLNDTFSSMVSFMNSNLHGLVNPEMLQFIINAKQSGEQIEALNKFLSEMADQAEKGVNAVVAGFAGSLNTAFKGLQDSTEKINDLANKRTDILEKMAKVSEGSREWEDLKRQLDAVDKEFAKLLPDVERWRKQLEGAAGNVDALTERSNRMGRLLQATFATALASGQSFVTALQSIQPALQSLVDLQESFGLEVDDNLKHLLSLSNWAKNNKELADALDGLNQLMKGLANSGAVTQQTFQDLGDEAAAQFQDLLNSGLSFDDSLLAMQPSLQTIYELQKRFGYTVDEATQKLLDEAKAAGLVGDEHETAAERTVDAMNRVGDILEAIARYMGVQIPEAIDKAAKKGVDATGHMAAGVQHLGDDLAEVTGRFQHMGDVAADAADRAHDGVEKVIYGSSPGGIDDLISHLDDAINRFNHAGDAAADGMDKAKKHTKEYIQTLVDLRNQLELDILGEGLEHDLKALEYDFQAKMADLKERFKNEPLGLTDALAALVEDYKVRQAQIRDKYNKEAADKQARADKERADQSFATQQALQQSQIQLLQKGIDQQVALLRLQKDAELRALHEKFGDQVEFYNQQAKIIENIYANKIQQAINENTQKIADENEKLVKKQTEDQQKLIDEAQKALLELQQAYTQGMRSLEDELQDLILSAMEDGIDKQLAVMQVQKERRLRALAEQFGAESEMYRNQAAILDQIYGIQAAEATAAGGNQSLSTLQKSFYALQNAPVQIGQEAARQAELDRLSQQIIAAQGAYASQVTSGIPAGLIPSNIGVGSQLAGLTADGTVRLEVVITDPSGTELSAVNFNSIEEAIATGRITLVARNSSQRSG